MKISGAVRLVIRRVLLGGVGWLRGGRSERSRERFREWRLLLREVGLGEWVVEVGGVETSIAIVALCSCSCDFVS